MVNTFFISTEKIDMEKIYIDSFSVFGEIFVIHKIGFLDEKTGNYITMFRASHKNTGFGIRQSDNKDIERVKEIAFAFIARRGKKDLQKAIKSAIKRKEERTDTCKILLTDEEKYYDN